MFRNYLKIAFRNFKRNKGFSLINILGLAVGMAVSLMMLMYVISEISFENFHINKDRIYRIMLEWGTDQSKMVFSGSMAALAPAMNTEFPEVEHAVRIRPDQDAIFLNDNDEETSEDNVFFSDPELFDIFSFELVQGEKSTALAEPFSLVLTESQAKKYFSNGNPMGQTLQYGDSPLKITGVLKDIPPNTHLNCQFLISYSTLEVLGKTSQEQWNQWGDDYTYLLLQENASMASVIPKLDALLKKNTGDWFSSRMKFIPQQLSEIHWDTRSNYDLGPKGNKMYVKLFLAAAFFVLIIACFNFINLSTSRYLNRAREIGVRKVVGARRPQLIKQFLTESFLITLFAIFAGVILFEMLLPVFYDFLGTEFIFSPILQLYFALIVLSMVLVVGLFAGGYPALFLSKFKPAEIMKNKLSDTSQKLSFRKFIVVLQFALSLTLILGTAIIYKQLNYMKNSPLGFDKDNVLLVNFLFTNDVAKAKYPVLRDELVKNPNILSATSAYTLPGIRSQFNMSVTKEGATSENAVNLQVLPADFGFTKTMNLDFVQGRDFSREYSTDELGSVILNESAVLALGLEKPIGAQLKIPGRKDEVTVIGIVRDFHVQSFHKKINPALIFIDPQRFITLALKVRPENIRETIEFTRQTWATILPGMDFNYRFLEDVYNSLYQLEEKSGKLLSIFTSLALFVSCLGLFGLTSFLTKNRTKEIGIRKVLGASSTGITFLISHQFFVWIFSASLLALPFSVYAMNHWLQNFAYRTSINWWLFVLAAAFELAIALLTIGFQTMKAALANPVESLRYE